MPARRRLQWRLGSHRRAMGVGWGSGSHCRWKNSSVPTCAQQYLSTYKMHSVRIFSILEEDLHTIAAEGL